MPVNHQKSLCMGWVRLGSFGEAGNKDEYAGARHDAPSALFSFSSLQYFRLAREASTEVRCLLLLTWASDGLVRANGSPLQGCVTSK